MEFIKTIPNKHYDLAIVDPPYGIGNFNMNTNKKYNSCTSIDWNNNIPSERYFIELKRIAKHHVIFGFQHYSGYLWENLRGVIIHDFGSTGALGSDADIAITDLFKRVLSFKYRWQGFIKEKKGYNRIHPCEKPVALYYWLLKNYAKPGNTIFDSHVGSGSIRLACWELGFDFEGCEIDKDYWQDQEDRFNKFKQQGFLFDPVEMQGSLLKEEKQGVDKE